MIDSDRKGILFGIGFYKATVRGNRLFKTGFSKLRGMVCRSREGQNWSRGKKYFVCISFCDFSVQTLQKTVHLLNERSGTIKTIFEKVQITFPGEYFIRDH